MENTGLFDLTGQPVSFDEAIRSSRDVMLEASNI
jgi:hypothetical protein